VTPSPVRGSARSTSSSRNTGGRNSRRPAHAILCGLIRYGLVAVLGTDEVSRLFRRPTGARPYISILGRGGQIITTTGTISTDDLNRVATAAPSLSQCQRMAWQIRRARERKAK